MKIVLSLERGNAECSVIGIIIIIIIKYAAYQQVNELMKGKLYFFLKFD